MKKWTKERMRKTKTIIVFCIVFIFGFVTGKNLNRTIDAYKSYKRWNDIHKMLNANFENINYKNKTLNNIKNSLQE